MAFQYSVCTHCFEKYGSEKTRALSLRHSKCLESDHKDGVYVRVRITEDETLEPEVRPTPRVHFKGEFVLCPGQPKCRGEKCTHPHCLKEKAAWNADKYGFRAPHTSSSTVNQATTAALSAGEWRRDRYYTSQSEIGITSCVYIHDTNSSFVEWCESHCEFWL